MEFNIAELLKVIIDHYGAIGIVFAFAIYYLRDLGNKLDRLINLNNKTFGVMLALVDKRTRKDVEGGDDNG